MHCFDFIVLGGGSAGYAAARTAREVCERVAIVDAGAELGGLCILRGCMPSKTLIYSAEVLHQAQRGALFGLEIPEARANGAALLARKRRMVEDFAAYRRGQLQSDRFTLLRERAVFIDAQTLELQPSGQRLTAPAFFLATGSVPQVPAIPGLDDPRTWTSDAVLELGEIPESVIVLGGGVVACELSQYLQRIGTRVTQIQRSPRLLKECSPEAAACVAEAFVAEGIALHCGTRLERIVWEADGVAVHYSDATGAHVARAQHLLNALGRVPASAGLGLEAAGVALEPNGRVRIDALMRTTNPRIYAGGDLTGPHEIVHTAILQGEAAARHATGRLASPVNYDHLTSVVFTAPQVAACGIPLAECARRGLTVKVAEYPFADHGKSILMEATRGYVKAWACARDGTLLGAECVGPDAGELIHMMAVPIALGTRARDLLKVHWYHPTLAEIWTYPLEELWA